MGVVGPNDYLGAAVAAGRFLYVAAVVNLRCQVRVFDLETARELEPVQLDEVAKCLPDPTRPCRKASVNMRAGGRYLYVASPARLTAIDIGDPGHAVAVVSREHYDPLSLFYGVERELVISGGALYEQVWLPPAVRAYRLGGSNGLAYEGETTWRSGLGNWHVAASARALYRPWRAGLVEYERSGQGFHVLRYLSGGKAYEASRVVVAGEYVYTLGYDEKLKQPRVTAYKIRP